jgi:transcriptional regulator GlxA family with amidase domain
VEAARRLLLESVLPVKRISRHCRFGSEEPMRRSFLRPRRKTVQPLNVAFCEGIPRPVRAENDMEISD